MAYLYSGLLAAPTILQAMVAHVDPAKFDTVLEPGRFTLREAVAHLADVEQIMRERVRICAEEPGSVTPAFDEDERSREMKYSTWDVDESFKLWISERKKTVDYIRGLTDEQRGGVGVHPERGPHSALDWAWVLMAHDVYHLDHAALYL